MRGVTFSAAGPTPLTPLRTTTSGRHARRCRPGGRWRRPMRTSRPRTTPAARRSTAVRCICRRQLTHEHHHHLATHTHTRTHTKENAFGFQKLFSVVSRAAAVPLLCYALATTMQQQRRRRHARRREQALERPDWRLLQGPRAVLRRSGEHYIYMRSLFPKVLNQRPFNLPRQARGKNVFGRTLS